MDYLATEPGIRIVAGLAFFFILYSVWMGQMTAQGLPDDYRNPVLALELVKNGPDIKKIVEAKPVNAEDGSVRDFLRRSTYKDFGFILVYALFFIALSLLLSRTNLSWARWAGYLAAVCAALGAIMDLIEDRGMLKAIAGEASDSLANSIRYPWVLGSSFLRLPSSSAPINFSTRLPADGLEARLSCFASFAPGILRQRLGEYPHTFRHLIH